MSRWVWVEWEGVKAGVPARKVGVARSGITGQLVETCKADKE